MNIIDNDLLSMQEARILVENAREAQKKLATFPQEKLDEIVERMAEEVEKHLKELAKISNEETDYGKWQDKYVKNHFVCEYLKNKLKGMRCVGIINEDKIRPEFVVSTEPTDGGIYRGQRGRMEIRVDVKGVSCHGSAPERGDNAIYKMADILQDVRSLNENDAAEDKEIKGLVKMLDESHNPQWNEANFLGKGTITVSEIFFTSPSRCAVADSCSVSLDRRMTAGETWESCLDEIRNLPNVKKYGDDVIVSMYEYSRPSYKGLTYPIECYFPTWVIPEDHKVTRSLEEAYKSLYGDTRIGAEETVSMRLARPLTDKWTFSTNGVSIMGRNQIPCIGFGPGAEAQAHAPNEKTWKQDLVTCAAVYAALPTVYCKE